MLNLESSKLKFTFNSEKKEMRFPSMKEWEAYNKKLKEKKKSETELLKEFFIEMGLDKETYDKLESGHVEKIIEALTQKKS